MPSVVWPPSVSSAPSVVWPPSDSSAPSGSSGAQEPTDPTASPEPVIRVVSGDPSTDELAAVTAVIAALAAEEAARAAAVVALPVESAWSQSRRSLRQPLHAGPGQWGRYPA